ncbi:TPA: helix-turn-helix transcriptional regulator [Clostridioides difficile]|uniref:helix-turn-helix domain-containing protein n=1 Tax=Clostridioides difficile TaxID=1496 RepID=UPI00038C7DCC|nr:helix-turn-helix transcriptional regulator [Clostridioides difficile]EQH20510.1 helix-turn-helix family protein [Clostridioides difficile DA00212]MBY2443969.1 helix-turn-helix transcriptional regulator [Clostridioides difficile]MCV2272459.1 helix-turn-helix transcriptional regulator [Clostridioides difficile]MDL0165192.1 helix-turn-helix transcriptional regulator [Clostridioides difficile]MDV9708989.1 helix-turn-helix transcriptional regulator [Clostridioides difficile]
MFNSNLKYYRKQSKLTQKQLALQAKVSKEYISQIERGIKNPGFFTAQKIAKILGITIDELFFKNKSN